MSSCQTHSVKRRIFTDAGRACPLDYRIDSQAFAGNAQKSCNILWVVGGLYGNPFALDAIEEMVANDIAAHEGAQVMVVFNGDAHWFDKTADNFAAIEKRIEAYTPLVGNVELELRRQRDVGVGCGCAYPECTPDEAVSRSNRIHKMLSTVINNHPELKQMLENRPATLTVQVANDTANVKVGITHGDEKLVGGWDCSRESLQDILRQDELDQFMQANDLSVFVTTHTCAPAAMMLARGAIINNGAAGLPNFLGEKYGLCVRIAADAWDDSLFETQIDGMYVQAIPVRYDHDAYIKWFDALWDATSPASISYRDRIIYGAEDALEDSLLGGFVKGPAARKGTCEDTSEKNKKATEHDVAMALAKQLYFEDMCDTKFATTVEKPQTLQINITARCNMACAHCHHGCNPKRTECMSKQTLDACLAVAQAHDMQTIDITGGAPEMHPDFEWFLRKAAKTVPHVMVRTNLTILEDPQYAHLIDIYDQLNIELVASLPNVFAAQADAQRGKNTHQLSLKILRELNAYGYGSDGKHILDLVFNPQEPILPPLQSDVEEIYKRRLGELGVQFDKLFAVANNPIGRYGASIIDSGAFDNYLDLLIDAYNPDTCEAMMCRHQLSVGWDGTVYDCDFNLALGLTAQDTPINIADYAANPELSLQRKINFGNHCYACTAGFGSSCGGTLVQEG